MITQEKLKELLTYDPETGIFKWIPKPKSFRRKYEAGAVMLNGYITIGVKYKHYLAHRLAFLYMTGKWPEKQVDHINRIRSDNRWINLREATPTENNCNRSPLENKKGNLPVGVYETVRKGRPGIWYAVSIQKGDKKFNTTFRKLEDAIKWRQTKEIELFGETLQ